MRMKVFLSETSGNKFDLQSIESLRHGFIVSEIRSNKLEHFLGVLTRIYVYVYISSRIWEAQREAGLYIACHMSLIVFNP